MSGLPQTSPPAVLPPTPNAPKQFVCRGCQAPFPSRNKLMDHIRSSTSCIPASDSGIADLLVPTDTQKWKGKVRVCEEQSEELRRRVYWTTTYMADISVRGIAAAKFYE